MKTKYARFVFVSLMLTALAAPTFAAEAKKKADAPAAAAAADESDSSGDHFRCKRMRNSTLAKLKEELVTNCNVNKPFSISATDTNFDASYIYCCNLGKNAE